jgi:hypothetical protein
MIIESLATMDYRHIQVSTGSPASKLQYLEDQLIILCLDLSSPHLLSPFVLWSQMSQFAGVRQPPVNPARLGMDTLKCRQMLLVAILVPKY